MVPTTQQQTATEKTNPRRITLAIQAPSDEKQNPQRRIKANTWRERTQDRNGRDQQEQTKMVKDCNNLKIKVTGPATQQAKNKTSESADKIIRLEICGINLGYNQPLGHQMSGSSKEL